MQIDYTNSKKIDLEEASKELSVQQVKNVIYEFKTIRHIGKNARKRFNMMRRKFKEQYTLSLQKFVEDHLDQGFTLAESKDHLLFNFSNLTDVSLFSISQLLKKQLKFRYKKLGLNNPIKTKPENKANLLS